MCGTPPSMQDMAALSWTKQLLYAVLVLATVQQECLALAPWARSGSPRPVARTASVFETAMEEQAAFWQKHPEARVKSDAKQQAHRAEEQQSVVLQIKQAWQTDGSQLEARSNDSHHAGSRRFLQDNSAFSTVTGSRLGLAFPPLQSLVPSAALNTTFYRLHSVAPPAAVDWRYTAAMTPVAQQLQCESCWAMAVADAVSIMVNIANGLGSLPQTVGPYATAPQYGQQSAATQLSVQQIMDCTDGAAANACQGGWPEWALEYAQLSTGLAAAADYPYLARQGTCKAQVINVDWLTQLINELFGTVSSASQITSWDRTPIMSVESLKKAVAQQPVVAFMCAVSADFQLYRGGVYGYAGTATCTQDINHVVLLVGYGTDPQAGDYWIVKNTWGPDWGENGYARIAIVDGVGVCGIQSAPGLYPVNLVTRTLQDPCGTMFPPPCGGGACYAQWKWFTAIPRCYCPQGYTESFSNKGVATCVPADPCGQNPNPCGPGACANHADGSYACTCPPGTVIGAATSGAATCVALGGTGSLTYTVKCGDTCNSIMSNYGLSAAQFQLYNSFLDCSSSLPAGLVLAVGSSGATSSCSAVLTTRYDSHNLGRSLDTLSSMAAQAGVSVSTLQQLNPGLTKPNSLLPPGLQVCTAPYQSPSGAAEPTAPPCGQSYAVVAGNGGDQCDYILVVFNLTLSDLLELNPGLDCSQPALPAQASICVKAASVATQPALECSQHYYVKAGDNCPTIWNAANLTASQFFLLNPGIQCDDANLLVGQQVCVAGPQSSSFDTAIPYTVGARDTLALVATMFQARCGFYATPLSICTYSGLADCTAPLVPGMLLLIPCQWPVGRSCGCPLSGVAVCGADGQWYPNYCSAVCNYATPANAYTNGGCSDLQLACAGHSCFGTPDWEEAYFPDTCQWPTWWPVDYSWWGTEVCSFYRGACWRCCTGSIGLYVQGYPSSAWYSCYYNCKGHVNFGC